MTRWPPGRIREERSRLGLTQEALARALGVSLKTVARWEKGDITPPAGQEERLSEVLGVQTRDHTHTSHVCHEIDAEVLSAAIALVDEDEAVDRARGDHWDPDQKAERVKRIYEKFIRVKGGHADPAQANG